jgi:fatty-acyl-CoA synthase
MIGPMQGGAMNATLDYLVRRPATVHPNLVAVMEGEVTWTWRMFDEQVTRGADALRRLGVGQGDRIAAADYNSMEYLALYYGAARLGAIICPLNRVRRARVHARRLRPGACGCG